MTSETSSRLRGYQVWQIRRRSAQQEDGMAQGHERLSEEYGGDLPAGLARLTEHDAAHLADAITAARRRQRAALAEASESGLAFVPRILRGPVKRVLFG
jgi:hypothetical protein